MAPVVLALCSSAAACARTGTVTVLLEDTTDSRASLRLYALPMDPARLSPATAAGNRPPAGASRGADSVSRYLALVDSARDADEEFQRERDRLNAEAHDLAALDRRVPAYARRWDAWRAREIAARSRRTARDRLRARAASYRARLGAAPPSFGPATPALFAAIDSAIRAGAARRAELDDGRAVLSLPPGVWWLGAAPEGAAPGAFVPVTVAVGRADSVRLTR